MFNENEIKESAIRVYRNGFLIYQSKSLKVKFILIFVFSTMRSAFSDT